MVCKSNIVWLLILFSVIPSIISCKLGIEQNSMTDLLPDNFAGSSKDGKAEIYERDKLYDYIDGAAEIYLRHDFALLSVQNYKIVKADVATEAKVEIYDMSAPKNAEALFDYIYGNVPQRLNIGVKSIFNENDEYEIAFCLDRYVCKLIVYERSKTTKDALLALAKEIESRIKGKGK